METKPLVIYGGGGFAREVAWLSESCSSVDRPVLLACFIDDDSSLWGKSLNGIPVVSLEEAQRLHRGAWCAIAVGSPKVRELLDTRIRTAGFQAATLIHPRVEMSRLNVIGEGATICAGNILTTNITIGRHVQINLDCTIGHDAVLGDYATLAPGVHVSGHVHIGRRAYIGTGAVLVNGQFERPLIVGDDAIVGAGACVIRDVAAGTTVGGVPAKPL